MSIFSPIWNSVSLAWPAGLLVALPFLALLAWELVGRGSSGSIAMTGLEYLKDQTGLRSSNRRWMRAALWGVLAIGLGLLWAGPSLRSTAPMFQGDGPATHKNILLMMDISRSMSVPMGAEKQQRLPGQAPPAVVEAVEEKTRFVAAREALMQFVERFAGERIGLILFSTEPFLARWPTAETDNRFLEVLEENIGRGEVSQLQSFSSLTNINKALDLAREVFREDGVTGGAVVMISDAEDDFENMGLAIRNLRKDGIRLYTIGVGIAESTANLLADAYKDDAGFRIFRVDSASQIEEAYQLVGNLEQAPDLASDQRVYETDLRWLVALAMAVLAGAILFLLEREFHHVQAGAPTSGRRAGDGLRVS